MPDPQDIVRHNAAWLRHQRAQLEWSTTDLANHAREVAQYFGDDIKLPQQLVSKFENGRLKSNPRWLGYAQMAIARNMSSMPGGMTEEFHSLRLSRDMAKHFHKLALSRQNAELERLDSGIYDSDDELTPDESDWLDLWRALDPADRSAVRQLMGSLAERKRDDKLHSPNTKYRAETEQQS